MNIGREAVSIIIEITDKEVCILIIMIVFVVLSIGLAFLTVLTAYQIKKRQFTAVLYANAIELMAKLISEYTEENCYTAFRKYPVCTDMVENVIYIYSQIMKYGDFSFERVVVSKKQPAWFNEDKFIDELREMCRVDDYQALKIISGYGDIVSTVIKASRPDIYYITKFNSIMRKVEGYLIKVFKHAPIPNLQEIRLSKSKSCYLAFSD